MLDQAVNPNMKTQRHKTAALLRKTAQQPGAGENSLHIYYGDSWLPLLAAQTHSLAMLPTRASSRTVATIPYTLNFSRPRESTLQLLPKVPRVLHKPRPTTATGVSTTTRTKRKTACQDIIQIWDGSRADQEYGSGLEIHHLAGGMGIAVRGRYTDRPRAGHVRYDAFLAHLVEGRMEETMQALAAQVEEARRRWGLRHLVTDICHRDDQTLDQDPGMIWNSQMIGSERRLNDRFICQAEALWDTPPRLHPYHVSSERVGMFVSSIAGGTLERMVSVVRI